MTRLMALVFWGPSRVAKDVHPHESPVTMLLPLVVLALLSIVGGWVGIPQTIGEILPAHVPNLLEEWLGHSVAHVEHGTFSAGLEWGLMGLSVLLAAVSALFAYDSYVRHPGRVPKIAAQLGPVYKAALNKFYVDEFYFGGIINPLVAFSRALWLYIDVNFVDRLTYVISDLIQSAARGFRSLQSGNMQQYALYIALGVVVTLTYVLVG
jgi:NADH-quinone oxidoreductase subunit L